MTYLPSIGSVNVMTFCVNLYIYMHSPMLYYSFDFFILMINQLLVIIITYNMVNNKLA